MSMAASPSYAWAQARESSERSGKKIREKRQWLNMSQPDLICALDPDKQLSGFTVPALSRIEAGVMIPHPAIAQVLSDWYLQASSPTACSTCGQEYQ